MNVYGLINDKVQNKLEDWLVLDNLYCVFFFNFYDSYFLNLCIDQSDAVICMVKTTYTIVYKLSHTESYFSI
jgi:hypothetical protein